MKTQQLGLLGMLCCTILLGGIDVSQSVEVAGSSNDVRAVAHDINLGLATLTPTFLDRRTAAITVSEVRQHRDLNGDGDMVDLVIHVFDASTGRIRNLGVSIGSEPTGTPSFFVDLQVEGRVFAFPVSEENGDLNDDGDTDDAVLHVYDTQRDALLNLRLAPTFAISFFDGRHLAFLVNEALQGHRDLNQDGDAADDVLHVFDVLTGRTRNTALAVADFASEMNFNPMELAKDPILFTVAERQQGGIDLNGDGDATDEHVLHALDNGRVKNLRLAIVAPQLLLPPQSGAGAALGVVQEEVDLTGDGDANDAVLQVVDIASGRIHNTGLAIDSAPRLPVFDREQGLVLIDAQEATQGKDLNGDGKIGGRALQVVSTRTGQVRNLRLSADPRFATKGRAVLVRAESAAAADLNGDGDLQDDVLTLADLRSEVPHLFNTRLAFTADADGGFFDPAAVQLRDDLLAFLVPEAQQGAHDLNADGDADDLVLHLADLSTFATLNTRLDGRFAYQTVLAPVLPLSSGRAVVPVLESRQGNTDLNHDGDTDDLVLQIFDSKSGRILNTSRAVAVEPFFPFDVPMMIRGESFVSFLAPEDVTDLNGDGDKLDQVHHLLDIETGRITNLRLAALGPVPLERSDLRFSFAGLTDSFGLETEVFFWLRLLGRPNTDGPGFGDAFTFLVSEAAQGNIDLNGDGDSDDVVVHAARVTDLNRNGRLDFAE